MQMADHLANDGFKEVGYEFINIDVCCINFIIVCLLLLA